MARINGNDLVIKLVTRPTSGSATTLVVAHSTTASLSISDALIDITSKDSNSWEEHLTGRKSATLSGEALLDLSTITNQNSATSILDLQVAGTQINWDFGAGTDVYQGTGFFTSVTANGPSDDVATYSFEIKVTGAVTKNFA